MTAESGTMDLMNANSAYSHSFGYLPDKTVYQSPSMDIDMREEIKSLVDKGMQSAELKAQTISGMGAGTAGVSLVPVYVDPRITDRSRKFTPWTELVQRVTNQGVTADFNYITSKGGAITYSEDAALADVADVEARGTIPIKYLYSVGRVTGQVQAAMPSYIVQGLQPQGTGTDSATFGSPTAPNAKQYEVLKRAQALKELEEQLIWVGSATTSVAGGVDTTEFNGIVTTQSATNQNDKSATVLEWDDIEDTVEYAYTDSGRPTLVGCDSSSLADMRKILVDTFRFSPKDMAGDAGFGVPARVVIETMLGPMPVIPSQYLDNSTGAKQIFFLDMEHIEMRVLQDMTYEDLAKNNDSQKFSLKMYEALVMKAPTFNSFIDNIA